MQETFHKLLGEIRGALRYRWLAIGATWAACLIGWSLVMVLPNVYESNARIFADTRTALTPVIKGLAIEQDVAAQLSLAYLYEASGDANRAQRLWSQLQR